MELTIKISVLTIISLLAVIAQRKYLFALCKMLSQEFQEMIGKKVLIGMGLALVVALIVSYFYHLPL